MAHRSFSHSVSLLLLGCLLLPGRLAAQSDSVTIAAGRHYAASRIHRLLLGDDYRDLWTTPVRVAVLDPAGFAGGLRAGERGGGKQTISMRLHGADGREYVFRSVDKDQTGGLPKDFQETLIDQVAQDQVSSKHPTAGLIAAPLLRAADILHATPRLFVMPDHPFLGEHRKEFAGMLGTLEERPDEYQGGSGFAGAEQIVGTEGLLERLEESREHRVDSRAYLRVRLMDFLMGDWDRHMDQWRWARFDRDGIHWWKPIPRDRDNAFSRYDGLVMAMVRQRTPMLVEFGSEYPRIYGLTANAAPLDRQLLSELSGSVFDSMAVDLQRRITDEIIDRAVASVPPEHHALRGAELAGQLRTRRDGLPQIARRFFRQLAEQPEIRATDGSERAEIHRHADGAVEVRIVAAGRSEDGEPAWFQRRFVPGETREIRIYLQGGDDVAVVRGGAERSILVRVIGGGGDDVLVDSSSVRGRGQATAFYDHRGDNRLEARGEAAIHTHEYEEPVPPEGGWNNNLPPLRDWGSETIWLRPAADWRYNVGPVLSAGPLHTRFGFRQDPFAFQVGGRVLYGPLQNRFGVELVGDFRRVNSPSRLTVLALASQLEVTRFHGFGNETPRDASDGRFKIWETRFRLEPTFRTAPDERLELFVGPVLQYTDPEMPAESPAARAQSFGSTAFGQFGAQLGAQLDTRDLPTYPRRGSLVQVRGSAFPAAWDVPQAFGSGEVVAASYFPLPLPLETTVALRVGGQTVWGSYPFQQAAFIGGSGTLRGYSRQRFAGDGAVFGNAEIRTLLTRFNLISRGDLGALALLDAGRVFADRESSSTWHTGYGAGVWVGILERTRTFSLVYAHGETGSLYFSFGVPF